MYTYDISQNTFTANSFGAIPDTEAAEFLQACGSNRNLYAVGNGGANIFTPIAPVNTTNSILTMPGRWSTITGVPNVGRSFGSCISMAVADLAAYSLPVTCTGC